MNLAAEFGAFEFALSSFKYAVAVSGEAVIKKFFDNLFLANPRKRLLNPYRPFSFTMLILQTFFLIVFRMDKGAYLMSLTKIGSMSLSASSNTNSRACLGIRRVLMRYRMRPGVPTAIWHLWAFFLSKSTG